MTALGVGGLVACSPDEAGTCLSDGGEDPGRACLVHTSNGSVEVRAEGLPPDSTVVVTTGRAGSNEVTVGPEGSTSGQLTFLGSLPADEQVQIEIRRPDGMSSGGSFIVPER